MTKQKNVVRVRPTGIRGRAARLGVSTLLFGTLVLAVAVAGVSRQSTVHPMMGIGATVLSLYLAFLWLRLPATGVYLSDDTLVSKSWWSVKRYSRADVMRSRAEPYTGWFFVLGWPVLSGALASGVVVIEMQVGARTLHGTVTAFRSAREQAEQINRWLGLEVGAGTGERRSRI